MTKPPVVQLAGMLRALGRPIKGERGRGSATAPDSGSTTRPTSRAGTRSAGWTPTRSAPAGTSSSSSRRSIDPGSAAARSYPPAETPEQALAAARAFWLDPRLSRTPPPGCSPSRSFQPPADDASTPRTPRAARAEARPAPERPASPDRRLLRLPEQLMPDSSIRACGCADFSRSELLRGGAAATAGRGLRAIEPGMPLPAGTGLSRRSFLARSTGLALAVFGGSALSPGALDAGIAPPRPRGEPRVLVSIFCSGGMDSLSLLAPVGDPRYATLRPRSRCRADPAYAFGEDPRLQLAPDGGAAARSPRAGKLSVIPAIGYADPNQSHFVSRHYWEVGDIDPAGRVGWLGRYLDRHGIADNPLQGLSLDSTLAPALATSACPSPPSRPRSLRPVGARRLGRRAVDNAVARWAPRRARDRGPELASARRAAAMSTALRSQLAAMQGHSGAWQGAVTYPATDNPFPEQMHRSPRCSGAACRCGRDARRHGGYDTHESQAAAAAEPRAAVGVAGRVPGRLEARGIADRVLVHVWSEFGRRPQANGSGTDHGAGGASLVLGSRANGTMVGEFPGLATARRPVQPAAHGRLPCGLQGPHRAVAGRLAGRDRPGRRILHRAAAGAMRALLAAAAVAIATVAAPADAAQRRAGTQHAAPKAQCAKAPSTRPARARRRAAARHRAAARRRASARRCTAARGPLVGESRSGLVGAPGSFGAPAPFASAPAPGPAGGPAPVTAPPVPGPGPGPDALLPPPVYTDPHALQVRGFEFGLQLSKATVSAGDVRVEFNLSRAEDPHNLWLVREDGSGTPSGFDEAPSGAVVAKTLALTRGRWRLFCSLSGHEAAGMRATLTVGSASRRGRPPRGDRSGGARRPVRGALGGSPQRVVAHGDPPGLPGGGQRDQRILGGAEVRRGVARRHDRGDLGGRDRRRGTRRAPRRRPRRAGRRRSPGSRLATITVVGLGGLEAAGLERGGRRAREEEATARCSAPCRRCSRTCPGTRSGSPRRCGPRRGRPRTRHRSRATSAASMRRSASSSGTRSSASATPSSARVEHGRELGELQRAEHGHSSSARGGGWRRRRQAGQVADMPARAGRERHPEGRNERLPRAMRTRVAAVLVLRRCSVRPIITCRQASWSP